jgi:hypothetical protein
MRRGELLYYFIFSVGTSRYLKTIIAKLPRQGPLMIRIYVKPDPTMDLRGFAAFLRGIRRIF